MDVATRHQIKLTAHERGYEKKFARGLQALAQYKKRTGHTLVPYSHVESINGVNFPLGEWLSTQRKQYGAGKLKSDRTVRLNKLGMIWDIYDFEFAVGIVALAQYKEREKHALVPIDHVEEIKGHKFALGTWVHSQRTEYNAERLASHRIDQLNHLEMIWDPKKFGFTIGLYALEQYKKREGNSLVPQNHVEMINGCQFALGRWLHRTRGNYKSDELTPDQIRQLNKLDMIWDVKEFAFDVGLLALAQYKRREKNTLVPTGHFENIHGHDFPLGNWIKTRRKEFKNGLLSETRIARLDELDMTWDAGSGNREGLLRELAPDLARLKA